MRQATEEGVTRPARWVAAALVSLAALWPAAALADEIAFDGPVIWTEFGANPVLDAAQRCGLNTEALGVTQEIYQPPLTAYEDHAALETRLLQMGELAGFGRDPGKRSVSRAFLRKMLTSRVLVTLTYEARAGGMACLERWLTGEGFRRVDATEAEAIRGSGAE